MIKFTPSCEQLKDALEDVYYEITQLIATLPGNNDIALNNALVESRLIHVRALLDFFQKSVRTPMKGRELDDVLCLDYGFTPQIIAIPADYQERLNKDLVHITYSRSKRLPKDKSWPHDKIAVPILKRSKQFGEHLVSAYLPKNYPEKLNKWQKLVDAMMAI